MEKTIKNIWVDGLDVQYAENRYRHLSPLELKQVSRAIKIREMIDLFENMFYEDICEDVDAADFTDDQYLEAYDFYHKLLEDESGDTRYKAFEFLLGQIHETKN